MEHKNLDNGMRHIDIPPPKKKTKQGEISIFCLSTTFQEHSYQQNISEHTVMVEREGNLCVPFLPHIGNYLTSYSMW